MPSSRTSFLTCSFRKLLCHIFKNKMFYRREGIWQHCWPTLQEGNEKYRGQIPASGSAVSACAINEAVKSPSGTSNFHNQYTSVKRILSYPVTSLSSQTRSLQGTLDRQKIHSYLSTWHNKNYPNMNSQNIKPSSIPWLICGRVKFVNWLFIFSSFFCKKSSDIILSKSLNWNMKTGRLNRNSRIQMWNPNI